MIARILIAAILSLVPVIATAQTSDPEQSGVEGVIMLSPSRPGPIRKDAPRTAPAGDVEFVVRRGDERITSFKTDAEGGFRVALPPGHYAIMREDPGARIGRWRFEVDVASGAFTKVNWTADSGMR